MTVTLTEEQAKPFRAQMKKPIICDNPRHKNMQILLGHLPIQAYPHSGGWKVPGLKGDPEEENRFWLYITCPGCGYEWAIWKLGVPRNFDPIGTIEATITQTITPLLEQIFFSQNTAAMPKTQLIGIMISKFFKWTLDDIKEAFLYALEDSNDYELVKQLEPILGVEL